MSQLATTGRAPGTVDNSHLQMQRGMNARPTNVESAIPRTRERDPNNFPYEYREYPKMMTMTADQAYLDAWLERHRQEGDNNRPYWPGGRPRVGVSVVPILDDMGVPIQVYDEDEETAFRAEHPEALTVVSQAAEIDQLRAENQRLRELQQENQKLRGEAREPAKNGEEPARNQLQGVVKKDEQPAAAPAKAKPKADTGLPPRLT